MKEELFPALEDLEKGLFTDMPELFSDADEEYLDMDALSAFLAEPADDIPEEQVPGFDQIHQDDPSIQEAPTEEPTTDQPLRSLNGQEDRERKEQEEEGGPSPVRELLRFVTRDPRAKALCGGAAALVLILCILVGVLIGRALDPYDNRILDKVTIGGIDVGGMTKSEARRALKAATENTFSRLSMEVVLPDGTVSLPADSTKAKLSVRSAVNAAYDYGRRGTDAEKQAALAASQADGYNVDMLPYLNLDQEFIRAQLEAYAQAHNVTHTELSYHLEGQQPELAEDKYDQTAPGQTLVLTLGTPREELDVDAVLAQILEAYSFNRFAITIDEIAPLSTPADPDLEAIYEEFYIAPMNTTLDMENFVQVPGAYGYGFNMEQAKKLVREAQYGDTIRIPMTCLKPEILGDEAYFRDELGYCETPHTNNEDRNTNLRLACEALDGLILQPGELFSYNDTLGERTKEKGYKPAAAYSGVNTVNSIGGGVCQGSTTLYNAALLADMEIVFRVNHGFRSSYIGVGLDATVNWGGPDFQFRNNSHFPVMIKAEVSDGYVKVKLLGTDEKDYYIKMTSGYSEDDNFVYSWSYKNKYSKETDELISKEKEAYSCYMKNSA